MKRAILSTLAVVLVGGGVALAGCPPGVWRPPTPWCPPTVAEPPCFAVVWAAEPILIELVVPWGWFCCPCPPAAMITGWSVEAFGGGVVHQHVFPTPVSADTRIVWDQRDLAGTPVAPGFYRIVVTTTTRAVETHVRIVARTDGCFFWWAPPSRPCAVPLCDPHLRVSRAPACPAVVAPCCPPGVFLWWILLFGGSGG